MSEYGRYDNQPVLPSTRSEDAERRVEVFERAPYAPTPLNPYALYKDGVSYFEYAFHLVEKIAMDAKAKKPQVSPRVHAQIESLLILALIKRFENNIRQIPTNASDEEATLFGRACMGSASIEDLTRLELAYPDELGPIEIAKFSNPYNPGATVEMFEAVHEGLSQFGYEERMPRGQNRRHYFINADDVIRPTAIGMMRKADIGTIQDPQTKRRIKVVQINSHVIDLCEAQGGNRDAFMRWIATHQDKLGGTKVRCGEPILTSFVDQQLELLPNQLASEYNCASTSIYLDPRQPLPKPKEPTAQAA